MRNKEILVTPLLKLSVVGRVVLITGLFQTRVEVSSILFVEVVRGQVRPTSKPPLDPLLRLNLKVSVVEVNGWDVRVPRMDHGTDSKGVEGKGLSCQDFSSTKNK